MLTWLLCDRIVGRNPTALGACIGAVVGLVAITPAAGFVSVGASLVIGTVAAMVSNVAVYWRSKSPIDDTLDVFSCHGVGGIVGMLLTAVFANDVGLTSGKTETFFSHLAALGIVAVFTFVGSAILYKVTDVFSKLRVHPDEEEIGLDLSQHGESIKPPQEYRLAFSAGPT
jgi:Amt family ammonium transporter